MPSSAYILAAWLLADFLSGVFHWWEDRYGNPDWPILGKYIVQPNIRHHSEQMAFLEGDYWKRNWTTIVPAAILAALAYATGQHFVALALAFLSQSNEVHSWAHQKRGRFIRGLQLTGLLHSPEQHAEHHKRPFDVRYCVMTDWLNPALEAVSFWATAEDIVRLVIGVRPRLEREEA